MKEEQARSMINMFMKLWFLNDYVKRKDIAIKDFMDDLVRYEDAIKIMHEKFAKDIMLEPVTPSYIEIDKEEVLLSMQYLSDRWTTYERTAYMLQLIKSWKEDNGERFNTILV